MGLVGNEIGSVMLDGVQIHDTASHVVQVVSDGGDYIMRGGGFEAKRMVANVRLYQPGYIAACHSGFGIKNGGGNHGWGGLGCSSDAQCATLGGTCSGPSGST